MPVRLSRTRKLRIGGQHLLRVRGHLYFGDNGNVALSRILHQLPQLLLCIIAPVGSGRPLRQVLPLSEPPVLPQRPLSPCGEGGKQRIAVYLHPPAGGICQMEVQDIELQAGHGVYLPLQVLYAEKMPGDILHEAPPLEAGCVLYLHAGDNACGRVPQCPESLHGVKSTGAVSGRYNHRVRRNSENIRPGDSGMRDIGNDINPHTAAEIRMGECT